MKTYLIWLTYQIRPPAQQVAFCCLLIQKRNRKLRITCFTQCYITKENYFPMFLTIQGWGHRDIFSLQTDFPIFE